MESLEILLNGYYSCGHPLTVRHHQITDRPRNRRQSHVRHTISGTVKTILIQELAFITTLPRTTDTQHLNTK